MIRGVWFRNLFLLIISISLVIYSKTDVVVIDTKESNRILLDQIKTLSEFYGFRYSIVVIDSGTAIHHVASMLNAYVPKGVIITGRALSYIRPIHVVNAVTVTRKSGLKSIPILFTDITNEITNTTLSELVKDTIVPIVKYEKRNPGAIFRIAEYDSLTRELSGIILPVMDKWIQWQQYYVMAANEYVKPIIYAPGEKDTVNVKFFKLNCCQNNLYFDVGTGTHVAVKNYHDWYYSKVNLVEMLPVIFFLRGMLGNYAYHGNGDYANYTVDDPWLTKQYGYLHYEKLLEKMKVARFHTTIAFTPWNYDRGKPEIVKLFSSNDTYFSICVHGNNHDHKEFERYAIRPYMQQEEDIRIAVARMDKMWNTTGLVYDKVMVFPQGISPSPTLKILKKNNFLTTINGDNIPAGEKKANNDNLLTVTVDYENFPSIKRYRVSHELNNEIKYRIAIDLFLDNPILLYSHHDFFQTGMEAFDTNACWLNSVQPKLKWCSLGCISKNCYRERLRDDGQYDIISYSKDIVINNFEDHDITVTVLKPETFNVAIENVYINGKINVYEKMPDTIKVVMTINSHESKELEIRYLDGYDDKEKLSISKANFKIRIVRYLSDVRDMFLPRSHFGNYFVLWYKKIMVDKKYLFGIYIMLFLLLSVSIILIKAVAHQKRKYKGDL